MAGTADLVVRLISDTKQFGPGLAQAKRDLDKLGDGAKGSTGKLGGLVQQFGGLGAIAKTAAVGAAGAAVALGAKGVAAFGDFEQSMREVYTLMPGISEQAMGQMEKDVRNLSKEMGMTTDQTVPALYQAISAGVPQDNVFDFMEIASKAAIGGVTDLETAVDGITSATNAYGLENLSAQEAADKMFTAVKLGKTNFEELSGALFQVAPIAAGMGVEFDNVTAGLAALTAQGVPTSVAATQLRGAIAELGKEGSKAFDAFQAATGKTFPDFIAEGGNLAEAFNVMKASADKQGTSVQNLFGSIEAGQAVLALTSETGGPAFVSAMEEMAESAGAVDEAFSTMSESQKFKMDQMKAQVGDAFIAIGEALAPLVDAILPVLVDLLGIVTPLIEGVGKAFGFVGDILGPVLGALGDVTGFLMEWATPLGLAEKGWNALGDAFDTGGRAAEHAERDLKDLGNRAKQLTDREIKDAIAQFSKYEARIGDSSTALSDLREALGLSDDAWRDNLIAVMANRDELELNADRVGELEQELADLDAKAENAKWAEFYAAYADDFAEHYGTDGTVERAFTETQQAAANNVAAMRERIAELGPTLSASESEWVNWKDALVTQAGDALSLFKGAADEIEITAEEMLTNMVETARQNQEWVTAIEELAAAGMDALAEELREAGPGATQAFKDAVSDPILAAALEMQFDDPMNSAITEMIELMTSKDPELQQKGREMFAAIRAGFDVQQDAYGLTIHTPEWETNWVAQTAMMSERWRAQMQANFHELRFSIGAWQITIPTVTIPVAAGPNFNITPEAMGGPVHRGQVSLVGERGPELVVFSEDARVIPNHGIGDWLEQNVDNRRSVGVAARSRSSVTINQHIAGSVVTEREIQDMVRRALLEIDRLNEGTGIRR